MSVQARVTALKQQLEKLFPGKWLIDQQRSRSLHTGIDEIDTSITRGITRKRITEWSGPLSSGKTSVLRVAVKHWCSQGLNVAYIDSEGKLYAADWSFAENKSLIKFDSQNAKASYTDSQSPEGIFWLVRPSHSKSKKETEKNQVDLPLSQMNQTTSAAVVPLVSRKTLCLQEAVWSADQFIRSNVFDVVILDMGSGNPEGNSRGTGCMPGRNRLYPKLQRALEGSRAALIVVYDSPAPGRTVGAAAADQTWACHARFNFNSSSINCISGLNGTAMIVPTSKFTAWCQGISQEKEVCLAASVPNRLFAHPRVPDRRTSKG